MSTYRHLGALGSSYAAGPGVEPLIERGAMRSGRNYPHLLAEALGARLTDLTISGATTETILDKDQRLLWRKFPPQIDGLPADVDLVTITAGGNDLKLIGSMIRLAWANRLGNRRWTRVLGDALGGKGIPRAGTAEVELAAAGLGRIVESVRERAPRARILLVDYLTTISEHMVFSPDTPFNPHEVASIRELGSQLAAAFVAASAAADAELVQVSRLSLDHGLGAAEPWLFGFRPTPIGAIASSFHPNLDGHRAVAAEIHRVLRR